MNYLNRILGATMLTTLVGLPYYATTSGFGLGSERNTTVMKQVSSSCPQHMQRLDGTCRRTYRSYFNSRSVYGGGPRYGK